MDTVELLRQFADPELIKSLSGTDKLMAGVVTTVLGMGITFTALIILQFVTSFMEKLSGEKKEEPAAAPQPAAASAPAADLTRDEELVAVISAAVAMKLQTSVSKIVIRNIERVEDKSPMWSKTGILENLNNSVEV